MTTRSELLIRSLGTILFRKSFSATKYVIRAKDPRLHRIIVAEQGFLLPEGFSAQGGAMLAGSSSSQQAAEAKEVGVEGDKQVVELG